MDSPDYDWELIKARLDQLREIRKLNKGQAAMIFALRTSLARNLGDMGNTKVRCPPCLLVPNPVIALFLCKSGNKEVDVRLY